jgi:hypothetical protein
MPVEWREVISAAEKIQLSKQKMTSPDIGVTAR